MPAPAALTPLAYAGLRLGACRVALRAFLARWGVYGAVAAALFGAGGDSPVASVAAAAAWTLLPLCRAASQPLALVAVVVLQSALGGLMVWAMRSLLWAPRWRAVERALPIPPADLRRSDAWVVAASLLPLGLLYAIGAAVWWAQAPAWLRPWAWRAAAGGLLMLAGTWVAGLLVMQAWRGASPTPRRPAWLQGITGLLPCRVGRMAWVAGMAGVANQGLPQRRPPVWRLVQRRPQAWWWALALWRGPAKRTGWTALVGGLGLGAWAIAGAALGPASGLPAWQGWWLAGFATLGLALSTRVNQLQRAEYQPLIDACTALPLARAALTARRAAWALLPLGLPLAVLAALLPWADLRAPVAVAYLLANALASAWEVAVPGNDPSARASRWGVSAVLLVALASAVLP